MVNIPLVPTPFSGRGLSSWNWSMHGKSASYRGLWPRAFTTYDLPGQPIKLTCEQISPVIPNNYEDSCLPMAVFIWKVELEKGVSVVNGKGLMFYLGSGWENGHLTP